MLADAARRGLDKRQAAESLAAFEWRWRPFASVTAVAKVAAGRGRWCSRTTAEAIRGRLRATGEIPAHPSAPATPSPTPAADRAERAIREHPDATLRELAELAGVSQRTVIRARRALVQTGEVEPKVRRP